jgi:benzoyl-CoA reductase/2-hydroxyglutaryl-CoA dehydratase subunit BcrC/BadD/HgdB
LHLGCRDLCIGALRAKELITKELGILALVLESDLANSRNHNAETMRTRVEAFAEVLRSNKNIKTK